MRNEQIWKFALPLKRLRKTRLNPQSQFCPLEIQNKMGQKKIDLRQPIRELVVEVKELKSNTAVCSNQFNYTRDPLGFEGHNAENGNYVSSRLRNPTVL